MQLDERKLRILSAIVELYIDSGEPVGSKKIAEALGFRVSPATIRNEMAALFDMGILEQPHTSAGRVPSHVGLRIYVDQLMRCQPLTEQERSEIDALFNVRDPDPDKLIEDAAQALAEYTNCASVAATITPKNVILKHVEFIPVATRAAFIIAIASNGSVRSKVCRVNFNLTPEVLNFLSQFANGRLAGKSIADISQRYLNSVAVTLGEYAQLFAPVLTSLFELCREISEGLLFTSGSVNWLNYKELEEIARDMLLTMGNKEQYWGVIGSKKDAMFITIGKENLQSELADASVVVTKYRFGEQNAGAIGVIGPVRMDYAKLIPHIEYFSQTLGKLLAETLGQDSGTI